MDNPGFPFTDPTEVLSFLQWIVGFIDDNSLNITFGNGQNTQQAFKVAHDALISWRKNLELTGWDLALKNTSTHS